MFLREAENPGVSHFEFVDSWCVDSALNPRITSICVVQTWHPFQKTTYLDVLSRPLDSMAEPSVCLSPAVNIGVWQQWNPCQSSLNNQGNNFLGFVPWRGVAGLSWNGTLVVVRHIIYGCGLFIVQCYLFYYLSFLIITYHYLPTDRRAGSSTFNIILNCWEKQLLAQLFYDGLPYCVHTSFSDSLPSALSFLAMRNPSTAPGWWLGLHSMGSCLYEKENKTGL